MKCNPQIYPFVSPKLVPAKLSLFTFRLGTHKIGAYKRKRESSFLFSFLRSTCVVLHKPLSCPISLSWDIHIEQTLVTTRQIHWFVIFCILYTAETALFNKKFLKGEMLRRMQLFQPLKFQKISIFFIIKIIHCGIFDTWLIFPLPPNFP